MRMPAGPATRLQGPAAVTPADFEGCDAVVHLAELSNDPAGSEQTRDHVQDQSRRLGAHRGGGASRRAFAGSSTRHRAACTASARAIFSTKRRRPIRRRPTPSARFWSSATVCRWRRRFPSVVPAQRHRLWPSPRMRFDIVLNDLCALAWTTKKIAMVSDGSPWRPIVHIEDICEAMRCARRGARPSRSTARCSTSGEPARTIASARSRRSSPRLPGLRGTRRTAEQGQPQLSGVFRKDRSRSCLDSAHAGPRSEGAEELRRLFERIEFSPDTYQFRAFTRLKQLKYLQRTGQVDDDLYWSTR